MKAIDFSYFIERFLAGEMNEAEEEWFRNELGRNEKLRHEIALRQLTNTTLKNHDVLQLRNKLAAIVSRKAEQQTSSKKGRKHKDLTRAAVFAGLVLFGTLAFLNTRTMSTDEIFDHYYKFYDITTPLRSANDAGNTDYLTAIEFFNVKDYHNAAHYFSKVLHSDPRYIESVLMTGVSKFEEEKYSEAKSSFTKVMDDRDNLFFEDAQWYLALCYLKTSEKDKAENTLKAVRESGSVYSRNAGKILKKIKWRTAL
ncbi:MAG: tetratricopeptide repeat protein [Bacteroidales bacterium]|nr:tetratricopeptide repeat protein [Bacteroidales bacterium]